MAKNVTIAGETYNDVPSIQVPLSSGQGNATFYDEVGNLNITQNGSNIDVSGYATVSVSVSGGGSGKGGDYNIISINNGDGTQDLQITDADAFALQTKSKSYTPTESQQSETISADTGYDGLSSVAVTVGAISSSYVGSGITRRSSSDLSASGATVSVPSGYYASSASKAVASGTAGTPTASKGTVSNHSISVTPSVTNATGYITGSTKTGTAVSVSASELVSGTLSVTSNGQQDVTNYQYVDVNVSGGGGTSTAQTSYAEAEPSSVSYSITIPNLDGEPTSFALYCTSSLSTGVAPYKVAAVVFDGTNVIGQTITNTSNAQVTYDGSGFSKSYSNGTLTITSTGAQFQDLPYILVYSYDGGSANVHTADVQVGSGATSITFTGLVDEPICWSCVFKGNFSTSSGYQRVIFVGSDSGLMYGLAMDSSANFSDTAWTSSYSNGSLTITSSGTNAGGYFHQPGYYQLTYAIAEASPYQKISKTYTPTTSTQTEKIEPSTGYDAIGEVNITVNAMPTMTLPSSASGTSSGTSKATITPTSSAQYLNIPTGYNSTAQYYTIAAASGGSANIATATMTNSSNQNTSISFTLPSGRTPVAFFCRCTGTLSRSSSNTYYYVADIRWDGSSSGGYAGHCHARSNGQLTNVTSGYSHSQSGTTFTITSSGARNTSPGSFYNSGYELVYVY